MSAYNPCPKCGGEAEIKIDVEAYGRWYLICQSCGARTDKYKDMEVAINSWDGGILSEFALKPCPFCGCEDVYKHDIALYETYGEGNVLCPSCKAQTYFMIERTADMTDRYDVLASVVAMWNRRISNEQN